VRLKPFVAALLGVALFVLQGCAQTTIRQAAPSPGAAPNSIRTLGPDQRFSTVSSESIARGVRARLADHPINILALSGGGADGAFGAGALVGLTRSASRPEFAVVTGVSTGALIAPYAFLGSDWDHSLTEVYTSGLAEHQLHSRSLGTVFGSSTYNGAPLKELVDRYTTDALIAAVAHEAANGRLLLVATTDVSTAEPVIWDLGSIALNGGAGARELFRDVLVASASVPKLFPPVVIRVQEQQALYNEVHVAGGTSLPFFVPQDFAAVFRTASNRPQSVTLYVIIDGRLMEDSTPNHKHNRPVESRSVSAGLDHMVSTTLELTAGDAAIDGTAFQFAAIPAAYPQTDSSDFRTPSPQALFQYGYRCAQAGRLWTSSRRDAADNVSGVGDGAGQTKPCPADPQIAQRLAIR
jgi:predicted acylesterase/phospholipase RssA